MDTTDRSFEPMDIDLSSSSLNNSNLLSKPEQDFGEINTTVSGKPIVKAREGNHIETLPISHYGIKRLNINLKSNSRIKGFPYITKCFFIVFTSIIIYYYFKVQCAEKINVQKINRVLLNHLYGQETAIQNMIKAIDNKEPQKLIILYGSTGVGKTYSINLMLENLWNCSNIYHYTMPSFKVVYEHSLMTGLILCPFSIVVVDGVSLQDNNVKSYIKDIINKSKKLEKEVNIFLIYNCNEFDNECNNLFIKEVQNSMSDIDATKFYIKFNTLSKRDLERCIKKELIQLNNHEISIDNLINKFNVTLDGCKSVYSKVRTLI